MAPEEGVEGAAEGPPAFALEGELAALVRALPKTETHLHIEGALPFELLRGLDGARFPRPPESWRPDFKFESFAHFERELLEMAMAWHTSPERYHESARLIFARHLEQHVRYVETSFASGVVEFNDVPGREILDAILAAVPEGLEVRVFLGIHHNGYSEKMRPVLDDCLGWPGLAGVDLHGTETFPLEDWTAGFWRAARAAGKFTKAHAGEFCGAGFVRRAVEELGVQRIEHGVRAAEDPAVVQLLVERGIALDVCPISNLKLDVVPTLADHPLPDLVAAGVSCTLSTDDPISFGNTLEEEYGAAARFLGFDRDGLAELARNGFRAALVDERFRSAQLAEIDRVCAGG